MAEEDMVDREEIDKKQNQRELLEKQLALATAGYGFVG